MTANRKKAPEYLKDDHLSVGTKEYLKVLNSGDIALCSGSQKGVGNSTSQRKNRPFRH